MACFRENRKFEPAAKEKRRFYICISVQRKIVVWAAKSPDKIGAFTGYIYFAALLWPARRDSNPRPLESESTAISSFATGGNLFLLSFPGQQKLFYTIFPDLASAFFTFFAAACEIPPFALAMPRTRTDGFSKKPNIQAENAVNFPHGKSILLSQR